MNYRTPGRTGLRVSEISLGTVEIGMDYGIGASYRPDEAAAARLLNRALDLGVNFIDTARVYGESEAIIGRALQSRRGEFILVSKALAGARESMIASAHESLRLLRTDVIDIFMIHSATTDVIRNGEAAEVLEELRQQGHIRFLGASVYGNETAKAAMDTGVFDWLQIAYNALDQRPETDVAQHAAVSGTGLAARSVLLKGALTDRSRLLPPSLDVIREAAGRLRTVAADAGISLPELAYRYVLSSNLIHSALVGASSIPELEQAVSFASAGPLPPDLMNTIRSLPSVDEFWLNPGNW